MQPPFAAWVDKPVSAQSNQRMISRGTLPTIGQERPPELIELELRPQLREQPAGAPLPVCPSTLPLLSPPPPRRTLDAHGFEAHLHAEANRVRGDVAIAREDRQLARAPVAIDSLQAARPALALRVVDFAKAKDVPLHDARAPTA